MLYGMGRVLTFNVNCRWVAPGVSGFKIPSGYKPCLETDSTYFPGDRNGSFLSASTHDSGTYGYPCRMSSSVCSVDIFSAAFHCCHFAHSFWRASSMPFCCSSSALLRSFPEASSSSRFLSSSSILLLSWFQLGLPWTLCMRVSLPSVPRSREWTLQSSWVVYDDPNCFVGDIRTRLNNEHLAQRFRSCLEVGMAFQ